MSRLNTLVFAGLAMALAGVHLAPAQTTKVAKLAVQSGNGQAACLCLLDTLDALQPIVVKATDSSGNPVSGATVTWTVTSGQITFGPAGNNPGTTTVTSTTAADGTTTSGPLNIGLPPILSTGYQPYLVSTIQATSNSQSVIFTETQSLPTSDGNSVIIANAPTFNGSNLFDVTPSGPAGTMLTTPIKMFVGGQLVAAGGVPNISVRMLNLQTSPTLTCANNGGYPDPGSVLSDASGNATCYPVLTGSGTGQFYILVGGVPATDLASALYLQIAGPFTFTSIPGAAASIQIVSGNNQVGSIGQSLQPMVAQVLDVNKNPVQGVTVNWSVTPAGAVAFTALQQQTDNNGEVSMTVSLFSPAAAGALVTAALASNPSISATFQETLMGALTGMTKISGDGQTAQTGTTFANPLVVQLSNANGPVANYPVQYQSTGPVSFVGGSTAGTNASGQASIMVKAGSTAGTATVVAIAGALNQTFTLTVTTGPTGPTPTSIAIVSGNPQTAAVNTAFGAPLVVQVNSNSGPVSGVTVSFSSTGPVFLSSGAATTNSSGVASITATAGATTGAATVTASISGGYSVMFNLTVAPAGPNLSASSFLNAASRQPGALSPCSLAIISAPGLTPDGASDYSLAPIIGRLPHKVHGLSVTFGGIPAPIVSVAMGATNPEVTVQVPCEVTPGSSVPVVVNVNGGGNAATNIPILALSPGIFQTVMSDGTNRAVVVRSDGSFADVGGTDQYDPNNPARLNEYVRVYATGLGPTFPLVGTDTIQNPNADLYGTTANVTGTVQAGLVGFGGLQVISARQAPDLIGVYEVQVAIPTNAPVGNSQQITIGVVPAGASSTTPAVTSPAALIPIGQ